MDGQMPADPSAPAPAPGAAAHPAPDPQAQARGDALAAKLAGYPGPAYRRAYLDGLLRSGLGFLRSGDARSAAYCLDKVEAALGAAGAPASLAETGGDAAAGTAPGAGGANGPGPGRPLDRLRARWREERALKAVATLERHGRRLTPLERRAYREGLAKWAKAAEAGGESAARRADHALLDLRRRLYGRILKSQRAVLVRRSGPGFEPVQARFAGPIGPYNDRQNLEGVLALLAQADPAWVEEFLELYRGLAGLKAMLPQGNAARA